MTTNKELNAMLHRLGAACKATGIIQPTTDLWLDHGSSTNGIAFRIWILGEKIAANTTQPFGTFHFGLTKRECEDRMHAMAVALEQVKYVQEQADRARLSADTTNPKEPTCQ
jgi:hypothetical protein